MRPYQEEYLANSTRFIALSTLKRPRGESPEEYASRLWQDQDRRLELIKRNMELLQEELVPALDRLTGAGAEEKAELKEFSGRLVAGPAQLDVGLTCQIQQAFLAVARQEEDRRGIIEHCYQLGIGRFALYSKLVNMDTPLVQPYLLQMRQSFCEAASYLKDFGDIPDTETRGYIIRAFANRGMGQFPTVGERTRLLKEALEVMENPVYRAMAPELPWDRYVRLTHQLMVSSMSHSRERAMTAQDVADIMKSVQTIYRSVKLTAHQQFRCDAIEFYCGIHDLDSQLKKMERLIDRAGSRDFSENGMYSLISLPAFYCQYLQQYPEHLGERERFYIIRLYQRIQGYLHAVPASAENEKLFFYLRQLVCTYVETEQTIPYSGFFLGLILRFMPEVYIHSRMVARIARTLCGFLMDRDPAFFDDIDSIRSISDPAEKRRAALDHAEGCGNFHDAGKINCLDIYTRTARRWFLEEYEMARLHTVAGYELLHSRASTARYASAAMGHHVWYNGARGYPHDYRREEDPGRRMVDVVALADWLVGATDTHWLGPGVRQSFRQAAERAVALAGTRFSPRVAAVLREADAVGGLQQAMELGRENACREIYEKGKV